MKFWTKGLVAGATMAMAVPAFAVGAGSQAGGQTGAVEKTEKLEKVEKAERMQYTGVVKDVDQDKKMVTLQLPLAPNVSIMKDGLRATLDDIKEGDDVRASFDPMSKKINRLDIQTKGAEPMPSP
jgi:Cu/Ag efflux protein CusF